jgi:threonine dehydrogenase-like Zn-dependent dehydrogenase
VGGRVRAAVLTGPGQIDLADRVLPPPGPGQVRLRVLQCGLCAGEVAEWAGRAPAEFPEAIGHEVAGQVAEVGDGVTTVRVGDHVAAWVSGGGFAEQAVAEERCCVPVAPGLRYPAVAEPLACVVNAVELAAPALGDDVAIVGAGFMGLLTLLVSALKGPRSITVADTRPDALARAADLARAAGPHGLRVITTDPGSLPDVIGDLSDASGADVTYEVTGVNQGLELASLITRMSGTLCIVGFHQGGSRTIPLGDWNWRALRIVNAHFRETDTIMTGLRAGLRLVNAGILDPSPLVTHAYPLSRIDEAFHAASRRPDGFIKAVVQPAAG